MVEQSQGGDDGKFWLRVRDGAVIRAHEARADERLGPYDTEQEAADGLRRLKERERRLEAEDEEWNG